MQRIKYLDGLRGIAILFVSFYWLYKLSFISYSWEFISVRYYKITKIHCNTRIFNSYFSYSITNTYSLCNN